MKSRRLPGSCLLAAILFSKSILLAESPATFPPVTIDGSQLHRIHSSLGRDFLLKIQLPEDYDKEQRTYPVLYLLDGDHAFALATDVVRYLGYDKLVPPLIIASPAYGTRVLPSAGGTNMRGEDFTFVPSGRHATAGGEAYLRFLKEELIPYVESHFRANPNDRTLWGYSAGGNFATDALFREPGLFQRIIITDGLGPDATELEKAYAEKNQSLPVRLFLAGRAPIRSLAKFSTLMQSRHYRGFWVDYAELSDSDHFAIPAEGLTRGLKAVFNPKSICDVMLPIVRDQGLEAAIAAYKDAKGKSPNEYRIDDKQLAQLIHLLVSTERVDDALAIGRFAAAEFPTSGEIFERLGDAYARAKNQPFALETYQKSLALNPGNPRVQKIVDQARKKSN